MTQDATAPGFPATHTAIQPRAGMIPLSEIAAIVEAHTTCPLVMIRGDAKYVVVELGKDYPDGAMASARFAVSRTELDLLAIGWRDAVIDRTKDACADLERYGRA